MVTAALAEPLHAVEAPIVAESAAVDADAAGAAAAAASSAAPNPDSSSCDPTASWPTYLLQFMHRFLDMREAEAQACAALAGVPRELLPLDLPPAVEEKRGSNGVGFLPALPQAGDTASPGEANTAFRTIRLPGPEAAAEVLRRSMLVRVSFFFWRMKNEREPKRNRTRNLNTHLPLSLFLISKKKKTLVHPRRLGRGGLHGLPLRRPEGQKRNGARRGPGRRLDVAPLGRRLRRRRRLRGHPGGLRKALFFESTRKGEPRRPGRRAEADRDRRQGGSRGGGGEGRGSGGGGEGAKAPAAAGARAVVCPPAVHPGPRGRDEAAAPEGSRGGLPQAAGPRKGPEQGPVGAEPAEPALHR